MRMDRSGNGGPASSPSRGPSETRRSTTALALLVLLAALIVPMGAGSWSQIAFAYLHMSVPAILLSGAFLYPLTRREHAPRYELAVSGLLLASFVMFGHSLSRLPYLPTTNAIVHLSTSLAIAAGASVVLLVLIRLSTCFLEYMPRVEPGGNICLSPEMRMVVRLADWLTVPCLIFSVVLVFTVPPLFGLGAGGAVLVFALTGVMLTLRQRCERLLPPKSLRPGDGATRDHRQPAAVAPATSGVGRWVSPALAYLSLQMVVGLVAINFVSIPIVLLGDATWLSALLPVLVLGIASSVLLIVGPPLFRNINCVAFRDFDGRVDRCLSSVIGQLVLSLVHVLIMVTCAATLWSAVVFLELQGWLKILNIAALLGLNTSLLVIGAGLLLLHLSRPLFNSIVFLYETQCRGSHGSPRSRLGRFRGFGLSALLLPFVAVSYPGRGFRLIRYVVSLVVMSMVHDHLMKEGGVGHTFRDVYSGAIWVGGAALVIVFLIAERLGESSWILEWSRKSYVVQYYRSAWWGAQVVVYIYLMSIPVFGLLVLLVRYFSKEVLLCRPVLFLRSFEDPNAGKVCESVFRIVSSNWPVKFLVHYLQTASELAERFGLFSPPQVSFRKHDWQAWVVKETGRASGVIVDVSMQTPGIMFELELVRSLFSADPKRVLLLRDANSAEVNAGGFQIVEHDRGLFSLDAMLEVETWAHGLSTAEITAGEER